MNDAAGMSGEQRMVRSALRAGLLVLPAAGGLGYLLRGPGTAASVAIALAIVLANFAVAGLAASLAGRRSPILAAFVGFPSFAVRMMAVLISLALLRGRAFVDPTAFAAAFAFGVAALLAYEYRVWRRTPWIALTFGEKP